MERWGHRTNETYKFDLPTLAGSLTGETHKITAVAYLLHANGDVESDSQSYTVKVYKPKIDSGTRLHDVDGYAELSRHYYSHPYIHVEGNVSAYHPGTINLDRYGFYRFRHKVKGPGVVFSEFEEPEGLTRFQENEPYGPYSTTSKLSCDISAGSTGDRYTADVYLKLQISGDVWVKKPGRLLKVKKYLTEDWSAHNEGQEFTHQ